MKHTLFIELKKLNGVSLGSRKIRSINLDTNSIVTSIVVDYFDDNNSSDFMVMELFDQKNNIFMNNERTLFGYFNFV